MENQARVSCAKPQDIGGSLVFLRESDRRTAWFAHWQAGLRSCLFPCWAGGLLSGSDPY